VGIVVVEYFCQAYNSDSWIWTRAFHPSQPVVGPTPEQRANVDARATRFTSRAVALDALPKLREALAMA
jgi:hypothetical protein